MRQFYCQSQKKDVVFLIMGIGIWEIIIIAGVILLFFGAKKLPELGKAFGQTAKEFKKGMKEDEIDVTDASKRAQIEDEKKRS